MPRQTHKRRHFRPPSGRPGASPSAIGPAGPSCPTEFEMASTLLSSEYLPRSSSEGTLVCADQSLIEAAVKAAVTGDCRKARALIGKARCRAIRGGKR